MVQFMWRNDSRHYQPNHTQASFHVLARIPHMDAWVADGKLAILAYVWLESRDIHILDSLIFSHFIVETLSLCAAPVQSITSTQGTALQGDA